MQGSCAETGATGPDSLPVHDAAQVLDATAPSLCWGGASAPLAQSAACGLLTSPRKASSLFQAVLTCVQMKKDSLLQRICQKDTAIADSHINSKIKVSLDLLHLPSSCIHTK